MMPSNENMTIKNARKPNKVMIVSAIDAATVNNGNNPSIMWLRSGSSTIWNFFFIARV